MNRRAHSFLVNQFDSLDSEMKLSRMCGTWALLLYGEDIAV